MRKIDESANKLVIRVFSGHSQRVERTHERISMRWEQAQSEIVEQRRPMSIAIDKLIFNRYLWLKRGWLKFYESALTLFSTPQTCTLSLAYYPRSSSFSTLLVVQVVHTIINATHVKVTLHAQLNFRVEKTSEWPENTIHIFNRLGLSIRSNG